MAPRLARMLAVVTLTLAGVMPSRAADAPAKAGSAVPELVRLRVEIPKAMSTHCFYRRDPSARIGPQGFLPQLCPMVPKGVANISKGKAVTASDAEPLEGKLEMLTDGSKDDFEHGCLRLNKGLQWVQLDLGESAVIYAIVIWHRFEPPPVYHDVIVLISDDPAFKKTVKTLFNNDHDNSAKLGVGKDWEYIGTNEGHLIEAGGAEARYVRCYINGHDKSAENDFTEIEIHGLAGK